MKTSRHLAKFWLLVIAILVALFVVLPMIAVFCAVVVPFAMIFAVLEIAWFKFSQKTK